MVGVNLHWRKWEKQYVWLTVCLLSCCVHFNVCHVFSTWVFKVEPCWEANSKFEPWFSFTFVNIFFFKIKTSWEQMMCLCRLAFECGMIFFMFKLLLIISQMLLRRNSQRPGWNRKESLCVPGRTHIVGAHPDVLLYVFRVLACWLTSFNQAQLLTFLLILCDLFW